MHLYDLAGKNIGLEGRCLVLTLLASRITNLNGCVAMDQVLLFINVNHTFVNLIINLSTGRN